MSSSQNELEAKLPCTIFCVHGNHEARANTVENYVERTWHNGIVYYQEEHPRLLFAKDGEVFTFAGKDYIVIGGAYSVDKHYRKRMGHNWFEDEQPSPKIKRDVESTLKKHGYKVHGVLSHTCPFHYEPRELFLSGLSQSLVDDSTEKWLDILEKRLDYDIWYFGHYHGEKKIDKMQMIFHEVWKLE